MNMLYKKPLLKTAVVTLLLTFLSNSSFAYTESPYGSILENEHNEHDEDYSHDYSYETGSVEEPGNFYMSFNYGKTMPKVGSFGVTENNIQKAENSKNLGYKNDFAGNASIGYRTGNMRVELEGHASSLDIEFENTRLSIINSDLKSGPYHEAAHARVDVIDEKGRVVENLYSGKASELQRDGIEKHIKKEGNPKKYSEPLLDNRQMENDGLKRKIGMINAYYDLNNESDFTPYLSIGGGIANTSLSGVSQIKPAIQGKLGMNYNISNKIQLSAGYKYLTTLGEYSFTEVKLNEVPTLRYTVTEDSASRSSMQDMIIPGSTTATVENKFANHALEVGLIFNF